MGQAKRRGTRQERVAEALGRQDATAAVLVRRSEAQEAALAAMSPEELAERRRRERTWDPMLGFAMTFLRRA